MDKNLKNMQQNELDPFEAEDLSVDENAQPVNVEEAQKTQETGESQTEIDKLNKELAEQKDKYIRLFAEFDNYKRRTSKEAIELRQTAGKEIIISLLEVLDDMDRAENQLKETDEEKTLKEGVLLIFDKFRRILQSKGLKTLETMHTEFDVEKDEAVSEVEVEDKNLKGKVVAELQKGYFLNDKLIRFAKVVVGK